MRRLSPSPSSSHGSILLLDDPLGLREIAAEDAQQAQRLGDLRRARLFAQRRGAGREAQAVGVGQQVVEEQAVDLAAPHLIEVLGAGEQHQVGRGDAGEAVCRAGPAAEAGEERVLQLLRPLNPPLDQRPQEREPPPRDPRLVSRRAEDRARRLAEAATVAAGDVVVELADVHGVQQKSPRGWQGATAGAP